MVLDIQIEVEKRYPQQSSKFTPMFMYQKLKRKTLN